MEKCTGSRRLVLPDGKGAVVPDGQEEEQQVQDPHVHVKGDNGQAAGDKVHDQLEPLILVLVLVLGLLVKDGDADRAEDDVKVPPRIPGQVVLHLGELRLSSPTKNRQILE